MISILIPTYNYNAFPLAEALEQQATKLNIPFEIVCRDDASFSNHNKENQKINNLSCSNFIEGAENLGRINNRVALAKLASYNWLLFLDADVMPKNNNFLKHYIDFLKSDYGAVFGGFIYENEKKNKSLRYKFGLKREYINANKRNTNPFKVIISANFLIKKSPFLEISHSNFDNSYGQDYLFSSKLKDTFVKVHHIDNEVYHLGIDNNETFIKKVKSAITSLHQAYKEGKLKNSDASLLKAFKILKGLGLVRFGNFTFKKIENKLYKNLNGDSPNLFVFDIYRLLYLCKVDSNY